MIPAPEPSPSTKDTAPKTAVNPEPPIPSHPPKETSVNSILPYKNIPLIEVIPMALRQASPSKKLVSSPLQAYIDGHKLKSTNAGLGFSKDHEPEGPHHFACLAYLTMSQNLNTGILH